MIRVESVRTAFVVRADPLYKESFLKMQPIGKVWKKNKIKSFWRDGFRITSLSQFYFLSNIFALNRHIYNEWRLQSSHFLQFIQMIKHKNFFFPRRPSMIRPRTFQQAYTEIY